MSCIFIRKVVLLFGASTSVHSGVASSVAVCADGLMDLSNYLFCQFQLDDPHSDEEPLASQLVWHALATLLLLFPTLRFQCSAKSKSGSHTAHVCILEDRVSSKQVPHLDCKFQPWSCNCGGCLVCRMEKVLQARVSFSAVPRGVHSL